MASGAGASVDEKIPEALGADDQCALPDCGINALQLHAKGFVEPGELLSLDATEEELMKWHEDYYGHKPRSDISVSNYKSLMKNITVQQKAILALWNESVDLEKEVQTLVKQVEHDSGLKVKDWVVLVEDAAVSSGARKQGRGNQPREAHVKQWIRYLPEFSLTYCVPFAFVNQT